MHLRLTIIMGALLALTGCDYIQSLFTPKPDIKFATYGADYQSKPDFALLESKHPLTTAELDKITPRYLSKLDQEEIDQIYARLTADSSRRSARSTMRDAGSVLGPSGNTSSFSGGPPPMMVASTASL